MAIVVQAHPGFFMHELYFGSDGFEHTKYAIVAWAVDPEGKHYTLPVCAGVVDFGLTSVDTNQEVAIEYPEGSFLDHHGFGHADFAAWREAAIVHQRDAADLAREQAEERLKPKEPRDEEC